MLMYISDDKSKSNFHRVRTPRAGENQRARYSMAYFNQASRGTRIAGREGKYPECTGEQFILQAMRRNYEAGAARRAGAARGVGAVVASRELAGARTCPPKRTAAMCLYKDRWHRHFCAFDQKNYFIEHCHRKFAMASIFLRDIQPFCASALLPRGPRESFQRQRQVRANIRPVGPWRSWSRELPRRLSKDPQYKEARQRLLARTAAIDEDWWNEDKKAIERVEDRLGPLNQPQGLISEEATATQIHSPQQKGSASHKSSILHDLVKFRRKGKPGKPPEQELDSATMAET
ncbi:hypothetical protein MMC08_009141 [Hypocenomyce scalaris]|nr:hypothetical protein [Hypocenomyce scalaris]